ncbi:MAG: histidinol dehydrogenase, partial [Betaproteobacteria bacterium]|nr:histidinol dehydrogenase [Betaproteobacteria bacterium]
MSLIHRLDSRDADFHSRLSALLAFEASTDDAIETAVAGILDRVRREGDAAVLEYTRRFDGLDAPDMAALELPRAELLRALEALPKAERDALELAVERVRSYHQRQ